MNRTDEEVLELANKACEILQVDREIVFGRCRKAEYVLDRHITWTALNDMGAYHSQLSRVFNINHSTAIYMVRKINNHSKLYPHVKSKLYMLKEALEIKI